MCKIDFQKFKSKITTAQIKQIMSTLGATCYKDTEEELIFSSICHSSNSHKLYYYPSIHAFKCWSKCSRGYDIISLVQKVKAFKTPIEALKWTCEQLNIPFDTNIRVTEKNAYIDDWSGLEKYIRIKNGESQLQTFDDSILDFFSHKFHEDWLNFGISEDVLELCKIRWYDRTNQIVIPCFNTEGELVGIRGRFMNPEDIATGKYKPICLLDGTSYKFSINNVLYGLNFSKYAIEQSKVVLIVESEKAWMKLQTWFNEKNNAVAMMGSNLGISRRNQLLKLGVNKVIYIPDNDFKEVGDNEEYNYWEKKMFAFSELFKGYATVEIVWDNLRLLEYKENATDRDLKAFEKLFENREFIS